MVAKVCEKYKKLLSPFSIPYKSMFYIPSYNMLYCRIEKCGTTSWVYGTFQQLAPQLGIDKYANQTRDEKYSNFGIKSSRAFRDILTRNPSAIAHVRHPFERIASAYLDKVAVNVTRRIIWKGMTFPQFVNVVLTEGREKQDLTFPKVNVHWKPMHGHCFFCSINYTVISKMETYSEDKARFLKMVGIKEDIREERMNIFGGQSIQDKTRNLFKEIHKKDVEALRKMYKYDFELFEFNPDMYG